MPRFDATGKLNEKFAITVRVTYDGTDSATPARPITLHTRAAFIGTFHGPDPREGFRLYRRSRGGGDDWELCDTDDDEAGCGIFDAPDVEACVGDHEDFASLAVGESWTTLDWLQGESWTTLPPDTEAGDVFRYRFVGATVDWWDWGGSREHLEAGTVVKLPCWMAGNVTEPADNGGRQRLVVPASEAVQFAVVE